jgi:hypothetical protein
VAQSAEQALTMALKIHGWWMGVEALPADVNAGVELNKEFFSIKMTPAQAKDVVLGWQAGGSSWKTAYYNLQRGDFTRPGVTAEEERAEIDREEALRPPAPVVGAGLPTKLEEPPVPADAADKPMPMPPPPPKPVVA